MFTQNSSCSFQFSSSWYSSLSISRRDLSVPGGLWPAHGGGGKHFPAPAQPVNSQPLISFSPFSFQVFGSSFLITYYSLELPVNFVYIPRYFNYDELVQIKDTVMAQHSEWKSRVEAEKSLKNLKRGRVEGDWLVEEVPQKSARGEETLTESPAQNLPKEASLLWPIIPSSSCC